MSKKIKKACKECFYRIRKRGGGYDKCFEDCKKNREKELKTIEDIIKVVNEKNIENFLIDFSNYLALQIAINKTTLENIKIISDEKVFHWIDDGKNNISINIKEVKVKE